MRATVTTIALAGALLFCLGCGGEKTYPLTLHFQFDENEAEDCTTYLADKFSVTVYSEDFATRKVREFPCPVEKDPVVELSAGIYYLTVSLLDANGALKSWGSAQVDLEQEKTLAVSLREYRGGITLSWPSSMCGEFGIERLTVTAEREGNPVTAVVWGAEREVTDIAISCAAKEFKIQNIAAGTYAVSVAGFRSADAERPRAASSIPSFKVTTGQDSAVPLKDHFALTVSDLSVAWEFDSKSIVSCGDAGVATIAARAEGTETFSQETPCDLSGKRTFSFHDLPADDYTVTVDGLNAAGDAIYTGHKVLTVEAGNVGAAGYELTIYLKQQ